MQAKQIPLNAAKEPNKLIDRQDESKPKPLEEQKNSQKSDQNGNQKVSGSSKKSYSEPIIRRSAGRDKIEIW